MYTPGTHKEEALKSTPCLPASFWKTIQSPGLAVSHGYLRKAADRISLECGVLSYKANQDCLWIAFMGGTGTGKSTIFNILTGHKVSASGVERPTTTAPVAYGHRRHAMEEYFPFPLLSPQRIPLDRISQYQATAGPVFRYVEHTEDRLSHLVLLDTPDLDSLEPMNRYHAEAMYLLSHGLVFVASQEKYADQILFHFMTRAASEGKSMFVVFNKAEEGQTGEELAQTFRERGLSLPDDNFFVVPFVNSMDRKRNSLHRHVEPLAERLNRLFSPELSKTLRERDRKHSRKRIADGLEQLLEHVNRERHEAGVWLSKLDALVEASVNLMLEEMKSRHEQKNNDAIRREVKKIFGAYDLLARPRAYVSSIVRIPLEMLGILNREGSEDKKEELLQARQKIDNSPILWAMERMNRLVLETLSPPDPEAPLFQAIREQEVTLSSHETEQYLLDLQGEIAAWLESTVIELERDLPQGKKVGIYSTSVIWGAAILSFETVLGGGITLLEMALNTVIAPFITKGSADLFAHRELKAIIQEMNDRYHKGVTGLFGEQRNRYARRLESLLTPDPVRRDLEGLQKAMETGP